jgi:hypothetical protein
LRTVGSRGATHRAWVAIACCAAAAAGSGAVGAFAAARSGWVWFQGDAIASVGQRAGTPDLVLNAKGSLNLLAGHVRLMSKSGRFVLAHGSSSSVARLVAFQLGTSNRSPIEIGDAAGTTTSLVVAGTKGQTSDLQQWRASGVTVAAIDAQGRLRIGQITIYPLLDHGAVILVAQLPDGSVQLLTPSS